ncbi:hypothetical protein EQG41_17235 [Billgrantia azerbaijanica]|nr:hypothetical protein EQG41_17235 [Halomonas azerbaijanica]
MKSGSSAAALAVVLTVMSPLLAADEHQLELAPVTYDPVYAGEMTRLAQLDNGVVVQGADVTTPDGYTSGFRLTAGYSPYGLPQLDIGAEFTYRASDEVPLSTGDRHLLINTTAFGGSLVAGVRMGGLGLYAKTGYADWDGDPLSRSEDPGLDTTGTSRIQGFGARFEFSRMSGRLEFEEIDAPSLAHLNLLTASVHIPF